MSPSEHVKQEVHTIGFFVFHTAKDPVMARKLRLVDRLQSQFHWKCLHTLMFFLGADNEDVWCHGSMSLTLVNFPPGNDDAFVTPL